LPVYLDISIGKILVNNYQLLHLIVIIFFLEVMA